jgi:hypothetical protein
MASSRSIEKDDAQVQNNVSGESAGNSAETRTEIIKKKKKKVFQVADCDVKYVLSFKPGTMDGLQVPELMIRKDPELAASWYDMLADMALFDELNNKYMLERQEDYKHQLKTKGRVTYERSKTMTIVLAKPPPALQGERTETPPRRHEKARWADQEAKLN